MARTQTYEYIHTFTSVLVDKYEFKELVTSLSFVAENLPENDQWAGIVLHMKERNYSPIFVNNRQTKWFFDKHGIETTTAGISIVNAYESIALQLMGNKFSTEIDEDNIGMDN